jgi:hypothetical protein
MARTLLVPDQRFASSFLLPIMVAKPFLSLSHMQVQAQVRREEQAAKEGRKLSKHEKKVSTTALNTGWRNMESSLCNLWV